MKTNIILNTIDELGLTDSIMVSKPLIHIFGLDAAILLCDLIKDYKYVREHNCKKKELTKSVAHVKYYYGMGIDRQNAAYKKLADYGIIKKHILRSNLRRIRTFELLENGFEKLQNDIDIAINDLEEHKAIVKEKFLETISKLDKKKQEFCNDEEAFNKFLKRKHDEYVFGLTNELVAPTSFLDVLSY